MPLNFMGLYAYLLITFASATNYLRINYTLFMHECLICAENKQEATYREVMVDEF